MEEPRRRLRCEQCGKPAIGSARDVDLCVDCLYKLHMMESTRINNAMRRANQTIASMEMITGVTGYPRYQVLEPPPILQRGPINFHNIKVDRSIVGAINSGDVQKIEVAMNNIHAHGGEALAASLKEFTEAVLAHGTLTAEAKNDIVE